MIVSCRLFLCLNLMPPGVSGVLLKIMLSCDNVVYRAYLSLCVLTACVLANKGVHYADIHCKRSVGLQESDVIC